MLRPSPLRLIQDLATRAIAARPDLWRDLKSDVANGRSPDTYGSVVGLQFQAAVKTAMDGLDSASQSLLHSHTKALDAGDQNDRCASRLVVAEIISRATRVVARHGFDG